VAREVIKDVRILRHKELTILSRELYQTLEDNPNWSPLYVIMVSISKGENTHQKLCDYFKYFYAAEMDYVKLPPPILNNFIEKGIKKGLIQEANGLFSLTEKGQDVLIKSQKVISSQSKIMRKLFSEKVTLLFSLLCLVFMSSLKILVGISSGSDALFNEGMENLTDIIKIFIITLSMKYNKDKLGSIMIIILMLFTGVNLVISSIFSLINSEIITPSYWIFILMFISILINMALLVLKNLVGKAEGNFSLLSDAKDNMNNIILSVGVIFGLFFAIFEIYFIDALIGLFISCLIIYDGVETLIELIKSGDEIEIDTFKLRIDEAFEFKIAYWLLMTIQEEALSKEELNKGFVEAITKGREILEYWATFGLYDIEKYGVYKILNLMEKRKLFIEKDGKTELTDKGIERYNKSKEQIERRIKLAKRRYQKKKTPSKRSTIFWWIIGISTPIFLVLLIIHVGPIIYDWAVSFLKGIF